MTSEASFAALCGASPVQASSGRIIRHRLNRGGNRQANNALWRIATTRMRCDQTTINYTQKRREEGKTRREIIRCLKRHIAREIYHLLTDPPTVPHGPDLRHKRRQAGITLNTTAQALNVPTTRISALERSQYHNLNLANRYNQYLTNLTIDKDRSIAGTQYLSTRLHPATSRRRHHRRSARLVIPCEPHPRIRGLVQLPATPQIPSITYQPPKRRPTTTVNRTQHS